jgi:3-phosphoshikimate 1-carboxyvinyltransferase
MDVRVSQGVLLQGEIDVPSSKSQTLRALFSAMLATGVSLIKGALSSEDTEAMVGALGSFGVKVVKKQDDLVVHSPGFSKLTPPTFCDVKDSGITLRFMAAFAALFHQKITFIGSKALMKQRSMVDIQWGLKQLGAHVTSDNGFCPFSVRGPIKKRAMIIQGLDSQPVSAFLWLLSLIPSKTKLFVISPHERPWIELTLSWLKKQKVKIGYQNLRAFSIQGVKKAPFVYKVPKDFSSAAFMVIAAVLKGHFVKISGLDFQDLQGDKALIYLLQTCGALIKKTTDSLEVRQTSCLNFSSVDVEPFIDAFPVMAVCALLSKKPVTITGAKGARGKESDRIKSMVDNLTCLGVCVKECDDGVQMSPSVVQGGVCESFQDHRIAMASALLGLISKEPVIIKGAESVRKTYPQFFEHLKQLGAEVAFL